MSKSQVGWLFSSHTFSKKKLDKNFQGRQVRSIPIKVCKIPNQVMLGIFFLWFWRDFFIFQVIPKEVLHLRVSLIIFNLIINQQNPNNCKKIFIRTIFNWKMSKLFGQAGRAHNKRTCPNLILSILRYQVGRVTQFGHMSKISQFFLFIRS